MTLKELMNKTYATELKVVRVFKNEKGEYTRPAEVICNEYTPMEERLERLSKVADAEVDFIDIDLPICMIRVGIL